MYDVEFALAAGGPAAYTPSDFESIARC